MNWEQNRDFLIPILTNSNYDYKTTIDAKIKTKLKNDEIYISYSVVNESKYLESLIGSNKAKLLLHVECTGIMYRKVFEITDFEGEVRLDKLNFSKTIEVCILVVACEDFDLTTDELKYDDTFEVEKHQIIGYVPSVIEFFSLNKSFNDIVKVSVYDKNKINFNYEHDEFISIQLPKDIYENISRLNNHTSYKYFIYNSIVFPTLLGALWKIHYDKEFDSLWKTELLNSITSKKLSIDNTNDFPNVINALLNNSFSKMKALEVGDE